jgi:hypothetical protein
MADGDKLTLGELGNSATSMTRLVGRVDDNFAFRVDQEGTGGHGAIMTIGKIHGVGLDSSPVRGGTGVEGQGGKGLPGELGGVGVVGNGGGPVDNRGDGVWGMTTSPVNAGVFGLNFGLGPAVRGYSTEVPPGGQPPVHPIGNGIGVEGKTGGGKGVHGAASADAGIGILAEHTGTGRGLAVKGRAGFSSCGSSTVAAGQDFASVNNSAVTATSHITVTLNADPGAAQLLWVERQTGSFTVHLTKKVQNSTSFTYLVVEPFS